MTMPQDNTTSESLADLYCLSCGYNQRGIVAERCPECGRRYAEMAPSAVRIPWAHRRHMGWLTAYWRTVWMVLFHGKQLCAEMQHPVSYPDARRFWLFNVGWVYFPFLAATVAIYFIAGPQKREETILFTQIYAPIWPAIAINLGILLFIAAATGVPSYLCHPRRMAIEEQNRAIALSYYAASPLAPMPVMILLLVLAAVAESSMPEVSGFPLAAGILLALLMLGTWYVKTVAIVAKLAGRWDVGLGIALPVIWVVMGAWLLILTPLLLHYSVLLVWSMIQ